jgi:hypothetical protein
VGRFERRNQEPGARSRKDKTHGATVGSLVKMLIAGHPSFSTNPLGDWKELVGEEVARYCQPQSLKRKVLVIVAYDSVWKHHLELHKGPLTEKINRGLAEPLVEKIVVRVGELSQTAPQLNPDCQDFEKAGAGKTRQKKKKKTPTRPLTPEEKALLKSLPDPDLRQIGTRLLKRIPVDSGQ